MSTLDSSVWAVSRALEKRNEIELRRVKALEFRNQIEILRAVVEYSNGAGGLGSKDLADRAFEIHQMLKERPYARS